MAPPQRLELSSGDFKRSTVRYRKHHLIVKFHHSQFGDPAATRLLNHFLGDGKFGLAARPIGSWTYLWCEVPEDDLLGIIESLDADGRTDYAEPDGALKATAMPDDPLLKDTEGRWQWGITSMDMFRAWDIQAGTSDVVIGLFDSGVPLDESTAVELEEYSDLDGHMAHKDLDGKRFIAGMDPILEKRWPADDNAYNHGTNMAGIIAATPDNSMGLAGVNWGSPVYVFKALQREYLEPPTIEEPGETEETSATDLSSTQALVRIGLEEILTFANASVTAKKIVLNFSFVLYPPEPDDDDYTTTIGPYSNTLTEIFEFIVDKDCIACIAAGNNGGEVLDPGRFGSADETFAQNVIVVGAVDGKDNLAYFSARGQTDMVYAPGTEIATTHEPDDYDSRDGTSHATAHVSALAAVMWSDAPHLKAPDIVRLLKENCREPKGEEALESFGDDTYGHGIIQAYAALKQLQKQVCLVLDRSGSMRKDSGIGGKSRLDIMKTAATDLVDLIGVGSSLGVVAFSSSAETIMSPTLIESLETPPEGLEEGETVTDVRAEIIEKIRLIEDGGNTSIGAGVKEARSELGSSVLPQAIIILTDGEENWAPLLESLESDPQEIAVYAIGMGTEDTLQPDALMSLTQDYQGYTILDENFEDPDSLTLSKFLGQIIDEISGANIVSDPYRRFLRDQEEDFGFLLGSSDSLVDAVLIRPAHAPFEMKITAPTNQPWGFDRTWTSGTGRVTRCRFSPHGGHLPEARDHHGEWRISVSLPGEALDKWLKEHGDQDGARRDLEKNGVPFTLWISSRSTTRMHCRLMQSGYTPGSTMTLRADLNRLGEPMPWPNPPEVQVTERGKDPYKVKPDSDGHTGLTFTIVARDPGIYRWEIVARNTSDVGDIFQRERVLTGAVWNPSSTLRFGPFTSGGPADFRHVYRSGRIPTARSS